MDDVVVGLVAAREGPIDLAREVAEELPGVLGERHPGVRWRVDVGEVGFADPAADARELVETVRRHMLEKGWDLAIGLTRLPLRTGRRPVSAQASATHGVGPVSVPALGRTERR